MVEFLAVSKRFSKFVIETANIDLRFPLNFLVVLFSLDRYRKVKSSIFSNTLFHYAKRCP